VPRNPTADPILLRDMLNAAWAARRFAQGLDHVGFMASALHQQAIIRVVGVVGEAAWRITPALKTSDGTLPWPVMAGIRHRIVQDQIVSHRVVYER